MGDAFLEAYEYAERLANRIEALEADIARLRAENEALRTERDELDALYHEGGTWEQQLSEAEAALAAAEAKAARLETALAFYRDAWISKHHPRRGVVEVLPSAALTDDAGHRARAALEAKP